MNPHRKGNTFGTAGVPGDPRLLDQLTRQQVRGPNLETTHVHSGTLIAPNIKRAAVNLLPLTIVQSFEVGTFRVVEGYVNQVMPTLGAVDLDAATKPVFTVAADTWVWLKCVGTFGSPDSYAITVETTTSASIPAGTSISGTGFTSFYSIGSVTFVGYVINNFHSGGNLGVDSWGLYNLWWRA